MRPFLLLALPVFLAAAGCQQAPPPADPNADATAARPAPDPLQQARDEARREAGELRFVVDRAAREVRIFRGDELVRSHAVAVGQSDHPTPTGSWRFTRVDINPDWTPPDSEWAEDREPKEPGEPGNPMGRARLVFNEPYTIHGTDEVDSLGRAASHGSIRVDNAVVLELAELLLRAGGAWEGEDWFRRMTENPSRMHRIELDHPVPIEVVEASGTAAAAAGSNGAGRR